MNVSLLITNFGKTDLFEKSLETIRPQLKEGDELCVADDSITYDGMQGFLARCGLKYKYAYLKNKEYRSGCYAKNVALKLATNPLIIINDPEVIHLTPLIDQIKAKIEIEPRSFIVPGSMYFENQDGSLPHGLIEHSMAPFVGGVLREELYKVGGWDERFKFWGNDDNDLMNRLGRNGVKHIVDDEMKALHQWHPRPPRKALGDFNEPLLYEDNKNIVANMGQDWGVLPK